MFDVGQKVICVRKEPWVSHYGPGFGDECGVIEVYGVGHLFQTTKGKLWVSTEVSLDLAEWPDSVFDAKWFRPKEPNIEALRSLLVSKKQTEKV